MVSFVLSTQVNIFECFQIPEEYADREHALVVGSILPFTVMQEFTRHDVANEIHRLIDARLR